MFFKNVHRILVSLININCLDHFVAIVGYGYDQQSGLNYYLIKNSWYNYN